MTYEQAQEQAKEQGAYALANQANTLIGHVSAHANDRGTSDRRLLALIVRASHACAQANVLKYGAGDSAASYLASVLAKIEAYPECEECDC